MSCCVTPFSLHMRSLTLLSPAKLNLCLYVVGRQANGYHRLLTLFHRISLTDTLRLKRKNHGISLSIKGSRVISGKGNLIARTYHELKQKFPRLGGVSVDLQKRIPVGAGLGGGSSNAASFLLGMKRLYRLPMSQSQVEKMGKKLGADVPFFLRGIRQAVGRGTGERLRPVNTKNCLWFVLLVSSKGLSTRAVFQRHSYRPLRGSSLTKLSRAVTMLCDFLSRRDWVRAERLIQNDLEQAATKLRPSIRKTIDKLSDFGIKTARMSGSGPTVFAILSNRKEADSLARRLKSVLPEKQIIVCHSF